MINEKQIEYLFNKSAKTILNTNDPHIVALALKDIIQVLVERMNEESRQKSYNNIVNRIDAINAKEIEDRKNPGGASIGSSISIIKNVLNGRDSAFIYSVLQELKRIL